MRIILHLFLAMLLVSWAEPTLGARPEGQLPEIGGPAIKPPSLTVRRIQQALTDLKHYHGPINGIFNAELEKAIRAYQKATGQSADGLATEELAARLETGTKVDELLQRLEKARSLSIDEARRSLGSNPETRQLLRGDGDEAADPARDASPCFRNPTARCLLDEAAASARAVFKPEMRDWALGEVLAAQARAGLTKKAMDTARRIKDPRLVMNALRDIAKNQAQAGRGGDALAAAAIIPDPLHQLQAIEAIATIQIEKKAGAKKTETGELASTIMFYQQALEKVTDADQQIAFMARLAVIVNGAGDAAASALRLAETERLARALTDTTKRGQALRHVAFGLAETGQIKQALDLLKEVEDKSEHTPVLVAAATAQARTGHAEEALATAAAIDAKRYRAVVLSSIAAAQAGAGDLTAARETAKKAYVATEEISLPFAKDYAHNQVALALLKIGARAKDEAKGKTSDMDFVDAALKAAGIEDDKLRAALLWTIADEQRRAGFAKGAEQTLKQANEATSKIKSALSQVWLFCDIAIERIKAGEKNEAMSAFNRALLLAEGIKNSWSRARALSKAATTMISLDD